MPKILIITLGTGDGVENGIAKSIKTNHPDIIHFLATSRSKGTIAKIEEVLGYKLEEENVFLIPDGDNIEECRKSSSDLIRKYLNDGHSPKDIFVDFTSGTKAMSAGAVLVAIELECENLSYVCGKRDLSTGRVIKGSEKVVILTPTEAFVNNKRQMISKFFNTFQFDACHQLLEEVKERTSDQEILGEFEWLENLVNAYLWWDRFDHKKASEYFNNHEIDALVLGCTHFVYLKDYFKKNISKSVDIIDSVEGVCHQISRIIEGESTDFEKKPENTLKGNQIDMFFITGDSFDQSKYLEFAREFDLEWGGNL